MRKLYSLVLMAAALLIGTNAWAANLTASGDADLRTKWAAADNNDVIKMMNDITLTEQLVLGTASMDGTSKSITLDLNGYTLTFSHSSRKNMFVISHGELNVITSLAGGKIIADNYKTSSGVQAQEIFLVLGSDQEEFDAKTAASGYFSHLTIGAGVYVEAQKQNAIVIDGINANWAVNSAAIINGDITTPATKPYETYEAGAKKTLANGARVDVYGQVNGKKYALKVNGNVKKPADATNSPYVRIHSGAKLETPVYSAAAEGAKQAIAAYSSGYARWTIEGTCEGATAVYVKGGEVDIENATIKSNYEGAYVAPTASQKGSGATSAGSAIVIESKAGYPGDVEVTVSGDTKVSAQNGYAIEEAVTTATASEVQALVIEGGVFEGGKVGGTAEEPVYGSILVSEATVAAAADPNQNTVIEVVGGQASNGSATMGNQELADYLADKGGTHITYVENEKGQPVMVISEGEAPTEAEAIDLEADSASVKLTANDTIKTGEVVLAELEMATDTLLIEDGATLQIGRVVLGKDAQIIVEPGAKLIVYGEQGIVAHTPDNIVLKNEDGKRSIFLFNPAVTSNKHPNAKVELITNSWRIDSDHLQWECFGLPTFGAISGIASVGPQAFIAVWENGAWDNIGIIGSSSFDESKLNKPFAAYDLLANRAPSAAAPKITIDGQLVGNVNGDLNANYRWTPFANSYTAELDLEALLTNLGGAQYVAQGVWVAKQNGGQSLAWEPTDLQAIIDGDEGAVTKIAPMQGFMLNNPGAFSEVRALDYASMVWAPATAAPAPKQNARRSAVSETTAKVRVIVANEQGVVDNVTIRENANNVYALEKYMNEDMNIYVMADEKSAIVNAEDMENTYVGFSTVKGGKFTISFASVTGREFTLVDHETGAQVAMIEGNTYEFTANGANDYRFEIVNTVNAPTAIENTEAVKSAKGIYTVTGQFVGEMNVWNTLPAGIYVVNGEKRVK